jgi:outer membrane immunogenic protein
VNAGVGFGTFKTDFNVAPSNLEDSLVTSVPLFAAIPGFAGRDEVYPGGFIGGGQIGFNWQFSPMWVVGLEADFQGADEKEHSTLTQNFSAPFLFANGAPAPAGVFGTTALDYAAKIEWFGTARLRAICSGTGRYLAM